MAGVLCVLQAPVSLSPLSLYLHVGPDLSLAPRTVWDETLASQGRGAGVAPVERMEPNYRPVCHLLWEKVEGRRGREGGQGRRAGEGRGHSAWRTERQPPKEDSQGAETRGTAEPPGGRDAVCPRDPGLFTDPCDLQPLEATSTWRQ